MNEKFMGKKKIRGRSVQLIFETQMLNFVLQMPNI